MGHVGSILAYILNNVGSEMVKDASTLIDLNKCVSIILQIVATLIHFDLSTLQPFILEPSFLELGWRDSRRDYNIESYLPGLGRHNCVCHVEI